MSSCCVGAFSDANTRTWDDRIGSIARLHSIYGIHLLGDYYVFPFSSKYHDVFSAFSVVNAFFRIIILNTMAKTYQTQFASLM